MPEISEHSLTTFFPWAQVKFRDILTPGVTRASRPVQEGVWRHVGEARVVTDDTGQWCFTQGSPLSFGEDAIVLPPKSEIGQFVVL